MPNEPTEVKPGIKTSEFGVSVAAMALSLLLPFLQQYADKAPPNSWVALLVPALVAAGYSISRGLAKQNVPPPVQQNMIETTAAAVATQAIAGKGVDADAIAEAVKARLLSEGFEYLGRRGGVIDDGGEDLSDDPTSIEAKP